MVCSSGKRATFLGICVGMQLMAIKGYEYEETDGLGWIDGEVCKINPTDKNLKIPHMGWNTLNIEGEHPVLKDFYWRSCIFCTFISYGRRQSRSTPSLYRLWNRYNSGCGTENLLGFQFHPEKSASVGLKMIENFLSWSP